MLRFGADQVVYERGSDCLDVFFIFEGLIRIDRCARRGDMAFFHYRRPGQIVGYYSAITGKAQGLTATAAEPALLGRMGASDFNEMILSRRPLSAYMLRMVTALLRSESNRISHLILLDACARVAAELLEHLEDKGGKTVHIEDRAEFAARIGMSRETTLARHLSALQRRGLLAVQGHEIHILDAAQLAEIVA
jgi:CRP-like cAMP-binding protein